MPQQQEQKAELQHHRRKYQQPEVERIRLSLHQVKGFPITSKKIMRYLVLEQK
ncbi:hypothetical protein ACLETV_23310 [Citrobacter braakii]|uniref:hypothetical protein n=1 Tax=Citrobacter braakii TaxID=57706 RepID=UPI0039753A6B